MRRLAGSFLLSSAALTLSALAITGCGFTPSSVTSSGSIQLQGTVMGGQQPVSGATVRLYIAGSSGNASAATDILGTGTGSPLTYATTDANGKFSITGDYTCPAATSSYTPQAYLVATGGNPGLNGNINNSSIAMVDALGPCAKLPGITTVSINEITTVAAAWALGGFASSPTNIGASSTNSAGLANAFLNANLIADPSAGTTPGSALPATNTIETGKVDALADIIATCVNSDGTTPCQTLFNTIGLCSTTCTSDTFSAALYVVQHPWISATRVSNMFGLIGTTAAYPTSLSAAPHDWTLSMTITGGGLYMPTDLALDSAGNVWVADYYGAVSAFNPQGTALSPTNGFGYGTLLPEIFGLAVDGNNNVWATIEENPSGVSGLYGITSGQTIGSLISLNSGTVATSYDIYYPESMATEQNGNIAVGNNGSATVSVYNYTPANGIVFTLANAGAPYSNEPSDVSGDPNNGAWLADEGSDTVTHVDASGNLLSHPVVGSQPNGVGTDRSGNAWVGLFHNNAVAEVLPGCDSNATSGASCYNSQENVVVNVTDTSCYGTTYNASTISCGGTYTPGKVVVDAAQNVWLVNYHGYSITEIAGNANTLAPGTGISPPTIYNSQGAVVTYGGYGQDAKLLDPFALAPDASGNIWVSNEAYNNLVMFFGIATPTKTPRLPVPAAP